MIVKVTGIRKDCWSMPNPLVRVPSVPVQSVQPSSLYVKLRARPNGPGRDAVASNQRSRLLGAMIEAMTMYGYTDTSVAKLCKLAGVSKRTFYEQFENKEQCFLETYDIVLARASRRINASYRSQSTWIAGLHSAFETLAAEIAEQPKAVRLLALEAPQAGAAAQQRVQRTNLIFQQMIASSFAQAPDEIALPPILIKGIVGGITRIVQLSIEEGVIEEPQALAEELLGWALSYRSPAATRLPTTTADTSPERQQAAEDERTRILRTAAQLAARDGFTGLTTGRIIRGSGVSGETFFGQFTNTEQCFGAAVDLLATEALASILRATRPASAWPDAVRLGIDGLLRHLAAHPELGRIMFVEIDAAEATTIDRRTKLIDRFTDLIGEHVPSTQPSQLVAEAITGAVWEIIHHQVVRDSHLQLPRLSQHLSYIVLAPLIGADKAVGG
jgi:AcrR family transcriptional regulator